jgi:peptide/nickel transport system permease protein
MNLPVFFARRSARAAAVWLGVVVLAAVAAPFFVGQAAMESDPSVFLTPPSFGHPLGTDALGRDLLMRLLVGASCTLGVGVVASLIAIAVGALVGAVAGWFGGAVDRAAVYAIDAFLCFPVFFLILAVVALLGPDPFHVTLILGFTGWMATARLVRAEVLSLRERPFILSSRTLGASHVRIIFRHLLPNAFSPVLVSCILRVSGSILAETSLSFLGLGIQPPMPSWGNLLADAKPAIGTGWWLLAFPGMAIFLTVFSLNVIGERMSEMLRGRPAHERVAR